METTKKEIAENTIVTRLKGFQPRFKYFYQNDKLQFSFQTGRNELEIWNKNSEPGEYPGKYFDAPNNKKEFIDFVYWYLNNQN
jgi:hypothetical protein